MADNPFLQNPYDALTSDLNAQAQADAATPLPSIDMPARTPAAAPASDEGSRGAGTDNLLPPAKYRGLFDATAQKTGVPVNVLMALAHQESRYNPTALGEQTKWGRAKGMAQYLDGTASDRGINPYNPDEAIPAMAQDIKRRLDRGDTMMEAIKAHFGGDDRSAWGQKTAAYGAEVMAKVGKIAAMLQKPGTNLNDSLGDGEQAMSDDAAALQGKLDKQDPGRYKVLTADEAAKLSASQKPADAPGAPIQDASSGLNLNLLSLTNDDKADWSYIGKSLKAGAFDVAGAAAKILDTLNPFTLSKADAATLFKDDPAKLKEVQDSSASMILSRFADSMQKHGNDTMDTISPDAKAKFGNLEYATLDPKKAAYLQPAKVIGDAVRSLPTMAALAVTAYFTRGAAAQAEKDALAAGMPAYAARQAGIEAAQHAAARVGAGSEGAVGYAQQSLSTADDLSKKTPQELAQTSPKYAELIAQGYTPETAKAQLVADTAEAAGQIGGIVDAAVNHVGGHFLGKILTEGGPFIKRVMKGFVNEGSTEAVQSAGEQLGQNVATQQNIDRNQDTWQDVGENAAQGLAVGGLTGGATAGAGGRGGPQHQPGDPNVIDGHARIVDGPDWIEAPGAAPAGSPQLPYDAAKLPAPTAAAPGASPLSSAVQNAANQHAAQKANVAAAAQAGERVKVTTPQGEITGALDRLATGENGQFAARVLGDDGQIYHFTHDDGVTIAPEGAEQAAEAAPASEPAVPTKPTDTAVDNSGHPDDETLYPQAVDLVTAHQRPSISLVQRHLRIGYNRAARLLERMEANGIVGPMQADGSRAMLRTAEAAPAAQPKKEAPAAAAPASQGGQRTLNVRGKRTPVQFATEGDAKLFDVATNLNAMRLGAGDSASVAAKSTRDYLAKLAANTGRDENTVSAMVESMRKAVMAALRDHQDGTLTLPPLVELTTNGMPKMQPESAANGTPTATPDEKPASAAGERAPQSGSTGDAAGTGKPVEQQNAALTTTEAAPVKWFGTQEKADAFIAKKGLADTHQVVETKRNRFEIQPKPAAQAEAPNAPEAAPAQASSGARKVGGRKLKEGFKQFSPDTGTLGIPREEMPQVPTESHGALVNHLNAQGIEHETKMVPADELKPTQAEYSPEKVEKAKDATGDRAVIVSNDGHIIDGHHQALAAQEEGKDVKAIVLDAPVHEALDAVKKSPSAQTEQAKPAFDAESKWQSLSAGDIHDVLEKAGFTDETGRLTPEGSKIAQSHFSDIPAGAWEKIVNAMEAEPAADESPRQPEPPKGKGPKVDFSKNKMFTEDKIEAARARLRSKLGTLNSGIDPEIMADGLTIAGGYLEAGVREFSAFASALMDDFGAKIKPYLLSFYEGARHFPGLDTEGMTESSEAKRLHGELMAEKPAEQTNVEAHNDAKPVEADARAGDEGSSAAVVRQDGGGRDAQGVSEQPAGERVEHGGADAGSSDQQPRNAGEPAVRGGSDGADASAKPKRKVGGRNRPVASGGGNSLPRSAAGQNHRIAVGELKREGSWIQTAERNVGIIEAVKRLAAEGRRPTPEEAREFAKYTGMGASEIANGIFPNQYGQYKTQQWRALGERLKAALTPEEYEAARRTTQYAHYTSEGVIRSVFNALDRLGFKGGSVLEPGMGVGHFNGLMPDHMAATSNYTGIEYDPITAAIAKALYPQSHVIEGDYTKTSLPKDFFDAAIGNPPFGSIKITNDPEYKKHGFMLHDYFFAKTLDRVKPGGLVVFVTSKGTMDKGSSRAREFMGERANLLGAVRLPQTAFLHNAGTEVVTDVIFLQKRGPGIPDNGTKWMGTAQVQTPQGPAHINEYFAAHPEMVLGAHALTGSMYRANEYTVLPREGDIEQHFAEALTKLPENVYRPAQGTAAERAVVQDRDFNPKHRKEGGLYVDDNGRLMQVEDGTGVEVVSRFGSDGKVIQLKPREKAWLRDYVGLRDAMKQTQFDQLNDGGWEKSLKALQSAYAKFVEKHGNVLEYTTMERTGPDGEITTTRLFKNRALFGVDAEGALAYALESIAEDGSIVPGAVLKGRVLNKPIDPEIRSTQDAMFVSLNRHGSLDVEDVARLAGVDVARVIEDLGTSIYEAPGKGWQLADDYLSGNVVRKLKEARAAARVNPRFQRNVDALIAAQPRPLGPTDITVRLGQNWVPPKDIEAFAKEIIGDRMSVTYNEKLNSWDVTPHERNVSEWGMERMPASLILDAVLNSRQIKITYKDQSGKTYTDAESTEKANDIARKMKEAFRRWVWTDTARSERLTNYYNEHFNNIAPRTFDGSHLTLPGLSSRFKPFDHQKRAIWRQIQQGDTYLAHAVGAGKTFEMIAGGMEQRRLGLIKKPVYAVPNHMLAQFAREFLEFYPAANIMVADEQNFHTSNRRRFIAQAALNNPDAIVITHSAFGRIGMSDEYTNEFIGKQIKEWQDALEEVDSGDRITTKQIERRIEALERRMEGKQAKEKKDKVLTFEELGADMIYVDEFHEFRKLDFATNQGNIKGIDPAGSQRAMDLMMKVQYLREKNPTRSLVAASGTPITNTMGELFTVQRFFQEKQLEEDGLNTFDAWASQYGDVVTGLEQNAAGGYENVSRFAKFQNVPELMRRVRSFMDILTSSHLGELVERPTVEGGQRQVVVTQAPDGYKEYQKQLETRITAIRNRKGPPQKGDDIILKVISDGRFSAIDMRFVDPTRPSDPKSKLNRMLDDVIAAYHETADNVYVDKATGNPDPIKGSSLIIFTDIGLGEAAAESRGFDMHAWIQHRLVEAGIPRAHIAFMRDNKQHAKKERLFAAMRAGEKRILIGGKDMETGVNVQKRLTHLFHLDAPWFPASVEQREGRIVRQGNQNPNVWIGGYATKGSYDSTMWGMNARKARFIEQAMNGDDSVRSLDDVSEASAFEMAAALASGDERYMKLAGLKGDIDRLERLRAAHHDEQNKLMRSKSWAESAIQRNRAIVEAIDKALAVRTPIRAGEFAGKVGESTFDARDDFSGALFDEFKRLSDESFDGEKQIGEIGGFPITYYGVAGKKLGDYSASVHVGLPTDPSPLIQWPVRDDFAINGIAARAVNQINGLDKDAAESRNTIAQEERRLKQIQSRLGAPFPEEQELLEKIADMNALETELAAEKPEQEVSPEALNATTDVDPNPAGDEPRRSIAAPTDTGAALRAGELGAFIGKLIDAGRIVLHDTARSVPGKHPIGTQAVTERDGTIHLVGENLKPGEAQAVLLHEMMHGGVRALIGGAAWDSLLKRLDALRTQAERSTGRAREFYDAARRRVAGAELAGDNMGSDAVRAEEFGAYTVEEYENAPSAFRKWVDDVLGAIKAWLMHRFGVQLGRVTPAQLSELAKAALRRAAVAPETDPSEPTGPRRSVSKEEAEAALNEAAASLNEEPVNKGDYIGRVTSDLSLVSRLFNYPRQIAAFFPKFTPVYRTAIDQMEARDATISELGHHAQAYDALDQAGKENVNRALELGRLMSETFSKSDLTAGVKNPGEAKVMEQDANGRPVWTSKPFESSLTKKGDTIKLSADEATAYAGLRTMFDAALDKFRDQTLEEMGYGQFAGSTDAAKAIAATITPEMTGAQKDRLQSVARFIGEIEQAKRAGYVPFARYGDYVVTVKETQPNGDDKTIYSTKVETGLSDMLAERGTKAGRKPIDQIPAVKAAIDAARAKYVDGNPNRRIVAFAPEQRRADQPVKLSDVDALAQIANIDNDTWDAVRDQLADAIKGQSFRKHFFHSDNVPGYSGDFERAIADYIIGMSGYLARRSHMAAWNDSIDGIKGQPKLYDYAQKYRAYANEPQEELAALRQAGYFMYIAGTPATAFANLTQVPLLTFPTLMQVAPSHRVAFELTRAYKDAFAMLAAPRVGLDLFDPNKAPADVRGILKEAWADGAFVPQDTYEMMMTARQRNVGRRKVTKAFNTISQVVSIAFSGAERLNRLVTFIAAARLAEKEAIRKNAEKNLGNNALARASILGANWSPKAFAEWAVDESQFRMGKGNRPGVMRGVGAVLMQFKGFMIQTLETWYRMAKLHGKQGKMAAAASLATLYALSGLWGMPGADDLRKVTEAAYSNITNEDLDLKTELREWVAKTSGSNVIAQIMNKGITYPAGVDLTRVGMGSILPDSALNAAGVSFDMLVGRPMRAFQKSQAHDPYGAVAEFAPNFAKNWITAAGWAMDGVRDSKGNRILKPEDLSGTDLAMKAAGFTPSKVTDVKDYTYAEKRAEGAVDGLRREFGNRIAHAMVASEQAKDEAGRQEADKEMADVMAEIQAHNEKAIKDNRPEAIIDPGKMRGSIKAKIKQEREGVAGMWGREKKHSRGAAQERRDLFGLSPEKH